MPLRLRFPLEGLTPRCPHSHAAGLYRLVLDWLDAAHAGLSGPLHDANQVKPLAISPLWCNDQGLYFEVSILVDRLLPPLLAGSGASPRIYLGSQTYSLGPPKVVCGMDWDSLRSTPPSSRWSFRFLSPTCQKPAGPFEKKVPLPSPELYFGSWLGRWNLCCEDLMDADLMDAARLAVEIAGCDGRTHTIQLPRGGDSASECNAPTFTGFVGDVTFKALRKAGLPADALRDLTALARFSDFCGTGLDTMRGMGQTVFL